MMRMGVWRWRWTKVKEGMAAKEIVTGMEERMVMRRTLKAIEWVPMVVGWGGRWWRW